MPLFSTSTEWTPLFLTPLVLVGWLVLIGLLIRSIDHPGPIKRTVRWFFFYLKARWERGRMMKRAVAREASRVEKRRDEMALPVDEHVSWASLWMVEVYLTTHAADLRRGIAALGWTGLGRQLRCQPSRSRI